jgi:hypothetical protein
MLLLLLLGVCCCADGDICRSTYAPQFYTQSLLLCLHSDMQGAPQHQTL